VKDVGPENCACSAHWNDPKEERNRFPSSNGYHKASVKARCCDAEYVFGRLEFLSHDSRCAISGYVVFTLQCSSDVKADQIRFN
jgi:hypothetical protein